MCIYKFIVLGIQIELHNEEDIPLNFISKRKEDRVIENGSQELRCNN